MVANPFIIYALPRSRTAWLSTFLTYKDWRCGHEQAIYMRSIDDIKELFSLPRVGTVETAAVQGWRILHHHVPALRAIVVRRPVEEVVKSMIDTPIGEFSYDTAKLYSAMVYGDRMLAQVAAERQLLSFNFEDLDDESVVREIFEYCLPYRFDREHWLALRDKNIQISVPAYIQYYHENIEEIKGFKSECWRELRSIAKESPRWRH